MSNLISTKEVAELLDVTPTTVARWAGKGTLPPVAKLPGRTGAFLFRSDDVAAFARGDRPLRETVRAGE